MMGRRANHRGTETQRRKRQIKNSVGRILSFSFHLSSLCLCVSVVSSSAFCMGADPGSVEDVQDVLFFHDSRPVLIRLHILVDGKPYPARWNEYLTRWFRFLDRDENGFLDRKEAERAPAAKVLQYMLSNPYTSYQFLGAPSLGDLDRDRDNKVSLAEFLRFYRQSPAGPVQLIPEFTPFVQGVRQDDLNDALFKALDMDGDGKLSRAELSVAEKSLHKYDRDENELIAWEEMLPASPLAVAGNNSPVLVPAMQAPAVPLMLVPREDAPRRINARLPVAKEALKRYDKNKSQSLSREEIGMPPEWFARLDANKDGELDVWELLRWVLINPDTEVSVRLDRIEDKHDPIKVLNAKNLTVKSAGSALSFSTVDARINLIAAASVPQRAAPAIRHVLVQQFKTIDRKDKGYLTKKQLHPPNFAYLHSILQVADRDEDDCLSLDELNAWVDLTTSGLNCRISVALAASNRGLFPLLDANQDGRLSIRELHPAWQRLVQHDRDGDGFLARHELPLQCQIVVNSGEPNYRAGQLSGFLPPPGTTVASAVPRRGPLWFRKMDRNGDGDVSLREFLGSRDDFRRLDMDGDGLISLEEAQRADTKLRKK